MEWLSQYALFLAEAVTVVVAVLFVVLAAVRRRGRDAGPREDGQLRVRKLGRRYERMAEAIERETLPRREVKARLKARGRARKAERSARGPAVGRRRRVWVLDFEGDLRATAVASLREEVTAILTAAEDTDEVALRLESSGGMVHAYGLAASQLERLRERGLRLTVCVDKVAASGGYMMACVADRVLAAPFAVVGSIGVVAMVPNVRRLLERHDIAVEQHTAGAYKRTLSLLGENTAEGRAKFCEELEDTHVLFKEFVARCRPGMTPEDVERVATGEHWYGTRALPLKLVDELRTSDDYLLETSREAELIHVAYRQRATLASRLTSAVQIAVERLTDALWRRGEEARYP